MSDKYKYGMDEPWDAEKAVLKRREEYRKTEERIKKLVEPEDDQTQFMKERPARRGMQNHRELPTGREQPTRREPQRNRKQSKKQRANLKGWLILILIALILIAIVVGVITLIVGLFSSDEEPESQPTTVATEPIESTESNEQRAAAALEKADRLAMSYDYDAAIEALRTYGSDWAQQPTLKDAESRYADAKSALVRWEDTTTIPHLSLRALIVDPQRAFDNDEDHQTYNQSMLTVTEFRAILQKLYEQGFVLVNMHDMIKESEIGELSQGDINLPAGKKPIVLSQEDVNYYQYRVDGPDEDTLPDGAGDGFASKLLLDENGNLTCEYIDTDGTALYGAYDFVPIVEEFVQEHPDFSYMGAKGVLAVTGVEGVFGFQTHPDWEILLGEDAYMEQIRQAQEVSEALKNNGWEIACYGYSKISFADSDADTIAANLKRWDNQVAPIVGKSDILFYPYGLDIGGVDYYSGDKYLKVSQAGFRLFCNMDSSEFWVQLRSGYMRQARRVIDGYRLEYGDEQFDDLFDVDEVIDPNRPRPVPSL